MRASTGVVGAVLFSGHALAESTFSPARPPSIPLAVKAPYLNSWLNVGSDGGDGGYLAGEWPVFWEQQVTAWTGFVRVDGTAYTWMGAADLADAVTQTAFSYTATRSTFVMKIEDKVEMNITFMSPVTPTDLKRQSLTFSYLDVGVQSLDGASHDVQLYADVTGEWAAGDTSLVIEWDYGTSDGVAYHQFALQNQTEFTESNQQANWGDWYWATNDGEGLTYQSGSSAAVRGEFLSNGALSNMKDSNFRAVSDDWPVFGLAHDLGSVGTSSANVVYTIGIAQVNAIELLGSGSGLTTYKSLWTDYFGTGLEALTFFVNDYDESSKLATDLDNKVASDSLAAAGQDYLIITSLSVRQAFGALQFTNTDDDPLVFLKEISSNSDIQTVDVIFPTMPLILWSNPNLLNYLLKPLFLNQESGHYPKDSAIHDLGTFPVARGYPDGDDEPQPLEECGNMIIMVLAYAQRTDDNAYLSQHYAILKQWAGYLVDEALIPADQISTDDFAGSLANQTDLAIKGMIGLRAMAEIAERTGNQNDSSYYLSTAKSYIAQWQGFGINNASDPPHTELNYGNSSSWGLLYNLYANTLLGYGADYVPQSVYDMQSNFYPTVAQEYGVPLDTRHTYTKSDWECWCAAIASQDTRDMFYSKIANWINVTPTNMALTDLYDTVSGNYPSVVFIARPVVGGHFAQLALQS
ncbi:glutaminase GtaA [Xylariomycetidae sp. FL0641]|nr:glutaminase GtaA [Xylariomycetidae sp. FL0641]